MAYIRQITAAFLLPVFLMLAAPHELIHVFYHEHESTDIICENGCGDHLSEKHEHCEVLQLTHPPLYFSIHDFRFNISEVLFNLPAEGESVYCYSASPFLFFRGPPALS